MIQFLILLASFSFAQANEFLTPSAIRAAELEVDRKVTEIKAQNRDVTSEDLAQILCPLYFPIKFKEQNEKCFERVKDGKPANAVKAAADVCMNHIDCFDSATKLISASASNPNFRASLSEQMTHLTLLSQTVLGYQSSHGQRLNQAFNQIGDFQIRLDRSLLLMGERSKSLGWPTNTYRTR